MPKTSAPEAASILGERVRERRHELGLSQERLAEGTALHWSFIGRIERGQANLTLRNILRLAAALDVDPGVLVTGLRSDD
ncbi:helix-turn-helix domain-containing protein [Nocardioides caeni]|uniref:helix-turn-helix domain-containing protein n=1 Tax=Nocardioides caeni TaxID=574700 RepID=UPI001875045B|nr:helix-turn-helix transcriptional regulator [Nocardioides caeni]